MGAGGEARRCGESGMSLSDEEQDVDAHTFRVLAPSLVPSVPAASRSVARPRTHAGSGTDSSAEEVSRLRKQLHLDAGARSPLMCDIEETFGRYASRPSVVRPRPRSADPEPVKFAGHPRRQLTRAAALGTPALPADDARQMAAAAIDEARRQADERVAAAVAAVRREAEEQLAKMLAGLDVRAREMAQQMAAAQVDRVRAETVEQLRAELRARDFTSPFRLIQAFRGWRSSAHRHADYKARLRRLECHFSHVSLSIALRRWKAGIMWCRRSRGLLAKAGRRMHSLRMGRAWMKWHHDTSHVRMGQRVDEQRRSHSGHSFFVTRQTPRILHCCRISGC